MRTIIFHFVLLLLFGGSVFSQNGTPNFHSGNKFRLVFTDDGTIGNGDEFTAEWPVGTGHEYLETAFPIIAVENGGQQVANFTPLPSFSGAGNGQAAMNHLQDTWPASWPDRPASWSGQWNGRSGRGQLTADQESLFALEDAALGLRLTVRGWQWSHYLAQDMIFLHYELTNTGSDTYDRVAAGFFCQPAPGGDGADDLLNFQQNRAQVTAVDVDNNGEGRGAAESIGRWSPVGRFSVALLETPGINNDGIDNDGDGLVDESRSDGIDNDGDWMSFADTSGNGLWEPGEPLNDDVGADGAPGTGDEGEADGLPTPGEPNFDALDIDESDQIGLTGFAAFGSGEFSATAANQVWTALTANQGATPSSGDNEFILGSGSFPLAPGETQRFSVVLYLSANALDQERNEAIVDQIYRDNYTFPVAPPPPQVRAVAQNNRVTLYWDRRSETAPDFEGYKIYRSTDPGFNDVYNVTDDRGILIYSEPIATFDKNNRVDDLFSLNAYGFRYFLGNNSGLSYAWSDNNVLNGKTYYYAIVAFDRGDAAEQIFPTESTKNIVVKNSGEIVTDINTVIVTPVVEARGYQAPDYTITSTSGFTTGEISLEIIDRRLIKDGQYQLTFDDSSFSDTVYTLTDITDPQNSQIVFENSANYSTAEQRSGGDPLFDGLQIFLVNDVLKWDSLSTEWRNGDSNWSISLTLNNNVGDATPIPADYEVRFGEAGIDTAIFTTPIPVPFQVWNITDNQKENILVLDQNGDGAWSSGELIFIVEGDNVQNFPPVYWSITLTAPSDPGASIPPENGDVAFIPTRKPFSSRDVFVITTQPANIDQNLDASVLENVRVVPNPYIVNSPFEQRSLYTGGSGVNKLQFTNLPQECTIRIYNLRGQLLDIIEHDSSIDSGSAFWNLRTRDNDKVVAFGVYIYHLDAPGIGEKIGRFAIIR